MTFFFSEYSHKPDFSFTVQVIQKEVISKTYCENKWKGRILEFIGAELVEIKMYLNLRSAQIWWTFLLASLLSTECQSHQSGKMLAINLQMSVSKEFWAQFCLKHAWILAAIPKVSNCTSAATPYATVWPVCSCIAFVCCSPQTLHESEFRRHSLCGQYLLLRKRR